MPTTYIAFKIRWIPRLTRTSTYTTQTCQIRAGRSRKGQGLVRRTFVLPVLKSRWYACLLLARTRRQKVVESVRTLFRSTYVLLHIYFMSFCETVLLSKIYLDHAHRRAHSFCLRKTLRRQGTSLCECVPRTHVSGWLKNRELEGRRTRLCRLSPAAVVACAWSVRSRRLAHRVWYTSQVARRLQFRLAQWKENVNQRLIMLCLSFVVLDWAITWPRSCPVMHMTGHERSPS